jgi:hypothetical protein
VFVNHRILKSGSLLLVLILLFNLTILGQKKANFFINEKKYYLSGTFSRYHAALGSGEGVLLSIELPESIFKKKYAIDSFFLDKKNFPFTIVEKNKMKFIEVNIFQSKNPMSSDSYDTIARNGIEQLHFDQVKSDLIISINGIRRNINIYRFTEIKNLINY